VQILADPTIALKPMTHSQATFSHHDLARFLHTRTDGAEQFEHAYLKVTTAPELVALGKDDAGGRSANQSSIAAFSAGKLWRCWRSSHCLVEARVHFQTTLGCSAIPDLGKSLSWTEDLGKAPEDIVS
jgi:hypothetical protein